MKKLLLLAFLILFGFIVFNRQRIFIRDPLATVYVNGVQQSGFQTYINYSNDVLLERDTQAGGYGVLVQNWNHTPGAPSTLQCLHWMACMTDADHATTVPLEHTRPYEPKTEMTSREVSFVAGDGSAMRVTLR